MTQNNQPVTDAICPVCASTEARLHFETSAEEAAQHFVLKENHAARHQQLAEHIRTLWQKDTCAVVQCERCGFTYAHPFVAGDAEYYQLAYLRNQYPAWRWEFSKTQQLLISLAGQSAQPLQLLEIGPGDGAFIKQISPALIPKENVVGIEYSPKSIESLKKYGITCLTQDVRTLSEKEYAARFDVICMFQVLEHMDDLTSLFRRLSLITKPNAHLFISVPNDKRVFFNEKNGTLLDMPPNHVGRWNKRSFEVMSQQFGWRMEQYDVEEESTGEKIKGHLEYRYYRKRQETGSWANRAAVLRDGPLRTLSQAFLVGLYAPLMIPSLVELLQLKQMGTSQWVYLKKGAERA